MRAAALNVLGPRPSLEARSSRRLTRQSVQFESFVQTVSYPLLVIMMHPGIHLAAVVGARSPLISPVHDHAILLLDLRAHGFISCHPWTLICGRHFVIGFDN